MIKNKVIKNKLFKIYKVYIKYWMRNKNKINKNKNKEIINIKKLSPLKNNWIF